MRGLPLLFGPINGAGLQSELRVKFCEVWRTHFFSDAIELRYMRYQGV